MNNNSSKLFPKSVRKKLSGDFILPSFKSSFSILTSFVQSKRKRGFSWYKA